ncbi:MAG TPA: winged helix-turn-helix domain-containing protein [Stellaceae bacterium]|nr:winged helix-turn-helix domain-containing protein [Stellaceae bacterium]
MPEDSPIVEFGCFRIAPHRRQLIADGRPIEIGGRAFDVLAALVEAGGAVVSKDALMRSVWPNRIVEDNSLQAQISALRNSLGADRGLICVSPSAAELEDDPARNRRAVEGCGR